MDGQVVGEIEHGLCVLVGVAREDGDEEAVRLAGKVARLRIFPDDEGRFDRTDFTIETAPARFDKVGDLWAKLRKSKGVDLKKVAGLK